jgi:hypothetical protein
MFTNIERATLLRMCESTAIKVHGGNPIKSYKYKVYDTNAILIMTLLIITYL